MTTFTSGDREEAYKKILEEAPNQPGYEDAVPIDVQLNASPPHIVDSGASVMKDEPIAYINVEERKLEWAKPMAWHTPTIAQMDKIPLYTHPAKTLTDAEIRTIQDMCHLKNVGYNTFIMRFARAILRKAQEK
jgi:hypothetical protein